MAPTVSLVVPIHNEARHLADLIQRLSGILTPHLFEIICIDDGSTDTTAQTLLQLATRSTTIVPLCLSRNFGKEAAIMAGLAAARGAAVIVMDGDFQHPPELIPKLIQAWQNGAEVVHAVKRQRGNESTVYTLGARLFNQLMSRATHTSFAGASDFKLLDRQVVDVLLRLPEANRFFRGLVAWVGFSSATVEFDVQPRSDGKSRWSRLRLVHYAIRNLVAFTSLPLKIIAGFGFFTTLLGAGLLMQTLYNYFVHQAVAGFTTAIGVTILLFGILQSSVGVLSMYVAVMYEEQKKRPIYIVRQPREPN